MTRFAACSTLVAAMLAVGCASTSTPVNMAEPRRVVGTENDVRVDAEMYQEKLSRNDRVALKYDITNNRPTTILVADLIPQTTFDPDTRIVTIDIGTEIPGNELLPRLIPIQPGEKKSFSTSARMGFLVPRTGAATTSKVPNALRVRVNFLGEAKPFAMLISIPEKAVHDPQLADQLFPTWIERNETVITNPLPVHWVEQPTPFSVDGRQPAAPPTKRGRG